MSRRRDKELSDFASVLNWIRCNDFPTTTVIGGIAVGAYAPEKREASLSADLDLLMGQEEMQRFGEKAPRLEGVTILKRPQPGRLPVMVIEWNGLEMSSRLA